MQLLRSPHTLDHLGEGATEEIYHSISKTADAYHDASTLSSSSSAAAHHARFLKTLIANDNLRARQSEKDRYQHQHQQSQPQNTRPSESSRFPRESISRAVTRDGRMTNFFFFSRVVLRPWPVDCPVAAILRLPAGSSTQPCRALSVLPSISGVTHGAAAIAYKHDVQLDAPEQPISSP